MPSHSKSDRAAQRVLEERGRDRDDADRLRTRLRRRLLAVAAAFAVLLILPRMFEPALPGDWLDTPPEELVGTWTSVNGPYADRSMEIGVFGVTLGLGDGLSESYPILTTRVWAESDATVYLITYETADGETELELHLASDGSLTLRNPSYIRWTKNP